MLCCFPFQWDFNRSFYYNKAEIFVKANFVRWDQTSTYFQTKAQFSFHLETLSTPRPKQKMWRCYLSGEISKLRKYIVFGFWKSLVRLHGRLKATSMTLENHGHICMLGRQKVDSSAYPNKLIVGYWKGIQKITHGDISEAAVGRNTSIEYCLKFWIKSQKRFHK
jgi:hypothetical protein